MKIENLLEGIHYEFTVGELRFKVASFKADGSVIIDVLDSGDLKVGEFMAKYEGDDIIYGDQGQYNDTIEMLRKTGDSSQIAANVKKVLASVDS